MPQLSPLALPNLAAIPESKQACPASLCKTPRGRPRRQGPSGQEACRVACRKDSQEEQLSYWLLFPPHHRKPPPPLNCPRYWFFEEPHSAGREAATASSSQNPPASHTMSAEGGPVSGPLNPRHFFFSCFWFLGHTRGMRRFPG